MGLGCWGSWGGPGGPGAPGAPHTPNPPGLIQGWIPAWIPAWILRGIPRGIPRGYGVMGWGVRLKDPRNFLFFSGSKTEPEPVVGGAPGLLYFCFGL